MRGATPQICAPVAVMIISIHAPRAGRDVLTGSGEWQVPEFQSTRPVRGATDKDGYVTFLGRISIHAPRAGRDAGWMPSRAGC